MGIIKRQGLKSSLVNYVGVGLGALFFLIIFPNILDKKYLGFYQLVLSLTFVFAQLPLLGTQSVLFKFHNTWKSDKTAADFNALAVLFISLGWIIFTILFFLFREQIIAIYAEKSPIFSTFYYIIPLLVIIQALHYYLEMYASIKLSITVPTLIREILNRVLLIIVFSLLAYQIIDEQSFILYYVIVFFIGLSVLLFYVRKKYGFSLGNARDYRKNNQQLKEQFQYGTYSASLSFITNLQNFVDAIILPIFMGLGALGIYGRPLILGAMINIPYRSIAYIASPVIMDAWHNNDLRTIKELNQKLSINLLLIGMFLFALIVVNADNFFDILPPDYRQAKNVLYIIAFGRLLDMSFGLNSEILFTSKYYKSIVWFTVITLILTIVLNITLIPIIGMEGAAIAVTFSLILFNVMKNILIYIKFGFHCFSKHYFSLVIIGIIAITVGLLIPNFSSQELNSFVGNNIASVFINVLIKSIIVAALIIGSVFKLNISPDFNTFFKLIISGKIFKGGHKMEEL